MKTEPPGDTIALPAAQSIGLAELTVNHLVPLCAVRVTIQSRPRLGLPGPLNSAAETSAGQARRISEYWTREQSVLVAALRRFARPEESMGSLGETLRQARLDRGLTLDDVANETHIRRRYLESLENEDYGALPAQVYTRGFIRTYARFLGLDPEMAVDLYLPWRAREVRVPLRAATPHLSSAGPLQLRIFLAIGGGLLLLFLVAYLWAQYNAFLESTSTVEPVSRTAVPGAKPSLVSSPQTAAGPAILTPSVLVAPRVPSPTPERGIVLELRTTERTWMEIWVDGNQQLQTTLPAGSTRSYTANTEIRMRLGNAGAVQATINGEAQGSLGERNQVKEIVWER